MYCQSNFSFSFQPSLVCNDQELCSDTILEIADAGNHPITKVCQSCKSGFEADIDSCTIQLENDKITLKIPFSIIDSSSNDKLELLLVNGYFTINIHGIDSAYKIKLEENNRQKNAEIGDAFCIKTKELDKKIGYLNKNITTFRFYIEYTDKRNKNWTSTHYQNIQTDITGVGYIGKNKQDFNINTIQNRTIWVASETIPDLRYVDIKSQRVCCEINFALPTLLSIYVAEQNIKQRKGEIILEINFQ